MQSVTLLFELSVAGMLISTGSYLQYSGLPGSALALTGLILGLLTVFSRTMGLTTTARMLHSRLNQDPDR